jgi:uncharacterized membrane protein
MYLWWKFVHIVGVLGFLAAHGATAAVALRLRREREPDRIRALLDLSRSTRSWMYVSLVVLLTGGVVTGSRGHFWGQGWIWAALGLLIALLVVAFPLAVPYYLRVRRAVAPDARTPAPELEELLLSSRPMVVAIVETAGLLVIVWLMVLKPF